MTAVHSLLRGCGRTDKQNGSLEQNPEKELNSWWERRTATAKGGGWRIEVCDVIMNGGRGKSVRKTLRH
ncbi:hypothetical protein JTE90_020848 [Oedothorax gibbosus]|uniref:Uncharacterized protein n=1 Tax=Oedothorax gibbosus TaxID=931172 RepID=A0AAV6USF6_9ARAC|nr:hypothetical protein JTE90_020848 [Oedothorax gibbosus]